MKGYQTMMNRQKPVLSFLSAKIKLLAKPEVERKPFLTATVTFWLTESHFGYKTEA